MAEQRALTRWFRVRPLGAHSARCRFTGKTWQAVGMTTSTANLLVSREGDVVTITLNRPETRNSLSRELMLEMQATLDEIGASDALGVILEANGPVFSAVTTLATWSILNFLRLVRCLRCAPA